MTERYDEEGIERTDGPAVGCRRIAEHLHAHIEGELEPIRASIVHEHLESCAACREVAEEIKLERLWFLESAVKSPSLSDTFARKVLKKIQKAERFETRRRLRAFLLRAGGAAAAAVLLLVAVAVGFRGMRQEREAAPVALKRGASLPMEVARDENPELVRTVAPIVPPRAAESRRDARPEETDGDGTALLSLDVRGAVAAAVPQPVVYRSRTAEPSFSNVIGLAVGLSPSGRRAVDGSSRDDPCRPDPNKDGKTDIIDVAYSCQMILVGQPPSSLEIVDAKPTELSDCDESCLRA